MKSSLDLCPCDLQRVFGKNRAWQWQCLCPECRLSCAAAGWSRLMRAMEDASRTQTPWYCVSQSSTSHYHTIFTAFLRKPPLEFSVLYDISVFPTWFERLSKFRHWISWYSSDCIPVRVILVVLYLQWNIDSLPEVHTVLIFHHFVG